MPRFCPAPNTPDKDIVMTPEWLAKDILDHYKPYGKFLDPCRGEGAFYEQYGGDKDYCELAEGKDFLEYLGKSDWIVTNPPWSKMRQFICKGMEVSDNVVYLTTINHYTTKRRLRDIREQGFSIKEIFCVPTPTNPWPQLGFQLAAVHIQKGYKGDIRMSWHKDC